MAEADAIPIRLEVTTRSAPPVAPIDTQTGAQPEIWRGEDVAISVGVFDSDGFPVDLSNLDYLEFDIFPWPIPANRPNTDLAYAPYSMLPFPSMPPAPILRSILVADDDPDVSEIKPLITSREWKEGTDQNGVFRFTWIDTNSLNLGGSPAKRFGFVVHGLAGGRKLTYGGGTLLVFEAGEQGIYLPNLIAPVTVPEFTILYIEPNQQLTFSLPITVEGLIEAEGVLVQVN